MLWEWPIPNKLSEMFAWAKGLWIRRVLVRAQEGQLEGPALLRRVGPLFLRPLLPYSRTLASTPQTSLQMASASGSSGARPPISREARESQERGFC